MWILCAHTIFTMTAWFLSSALYFPISLFIPRSRSISPKLSLLHILNFCALLRTFKCISISDVDITQLFNWPGEKKKTNTMPNCVINCHLFGFTRLTLISYRIRVNLIGCYYALRCSKITHRYFYLMLTFSSGVIDKCQRILCGTKIWEKVREEKNYRHIVQSERKMCCPDKPLYLMGGYLKIKIYHSNQYR